MNLNRPQRVVLAVGSLIFAAMLIWVPYSATYKFKDSILTAEAGYETVLTPPGIDICKYSLELHANRTFNENSFSAELCQINIDGRRLGMTLAATMLALISTLIIIGLTTKNPMPHADQGHTDNPTKSTSPVNSKIGAHLLALDPSLPIGPGDLTMNNPLMITSEADYIPVEYRIMDLIHAEMSDVEPKFVTQGVSLRGDRRIDELDFRYRKLHEKTWSEKTTYYFDITVGMNATRRKMEHKWWQIWR